MKKGNLSLFFAIAALGLEPKAPAKPYTTDLVHVSVRFVLLCLKYTVSWATESLVLMGCGGVMGSNTKTGQGVLEYRMREVRLSTLHYTENPES